MLSKKDHLGQTLRHRRWAAQVLGCVSEVVRSLLLDFRAIMLICRRMEIFDNGKHGQFDFPCSNYIADNDSMLLVRVAIATRPCR